MEKIKSDARGAWPRLTRRVVIAIATVIALATLVIFTRGNHAPYTLEFDKPVIESRRIDTNVAFALVRMDVRNPNPFPVWIRTTKREAAIDGYRNDPGNTPFESEIPAGGKVAVSSGTILLDHPSPTPRAGTADFRLCYGREQTELAKAKTIRTTFRIAQDASRGNGPVIDDPKITDMPCG